MKKAGKHESRKAATHITSPFATLLLPPRAIALCRTAQVLHGDRLLTAGVQQSRGIGRVQRACTDTSTHKPAPVLRQPLRGAARGGAALGFGLRGPELLCRCGCTRPHHGIKVDCVNALAPHPSECDDVIRGAHVSISRR